MRDCGRISVSGIGFAYQNPMMGRSENFHPASGYDTSVLVVEDEAISRRALVTLLRHMGYDSVAVGTAEEALSLVANGHHADIALIDLDLPGMSGSDLIDRLAEIDRKMTPIIISAADQERLRREAARRHVQALRKPLNFEQLLSVLAESKTTH